MNAAFVPGGLWSPFAASPRRRSYTRMTVTRRAPQNGAQLQQVLAQQPLPLAFLLVFSRRCRACARVSRPFERLAQQHAASAWFASVCAEEASCLVADLHVRAFPTFVVFRDGKRVDHFATSCSDTLTEHVSDWL